eukprot:scaffold11894_cov148-Isochrysis_galbana.AAC.5
MTIEQRPHGAALESSRAATIAGSEGGGVEGDRGARGVRVLEGGSPQVNASTPTPLFQPRCRPSTGLWGLGGNRERTVRGVCVRTVTVPRVQAAPITHDTLSKTRPYSSSSLPYALRARPSSYVHTRARPRAGGPAPCVVVVRFALRPYDTEDVTTTTGVVCETEVGPPAWLDPV